MIPLHKKMLLIIYLILVPTILINIYENSIDDFIPKHMAVAYQMSNDQLTSEGKYIYDQIPGFYAFITITLYPYFAIVLLATYILSDKNKMVSALLTLFYMSITTTGTLKIFLWPHGIGGLLFFMLVVTTYKVIKSPKLKNSYLILCILATVSITFISYNFTYYCIVYLFSLSILQWIFKKPSEVFINTLLILLGTLMGFSSFVYGHAKPLLELSNSLYILKTFERFLINFFDIGHVNLDPIQNYLMTYPQLLTHIFLTKYVLMIPILTISIFSIIYAETHKKIESVKFNLVLSVCLAVTLFILTRLTIGHFSIPEIWYIFMVALPISYPLLKKRPKFLIKVSLIILIILNFSAIIVSNASEVVQKDEYSYIVNAASWLYQKEPQNRIYTPDQLTYGWTYLPCTLKFNNWNEPKYLGIEDILNIYRGKKISSSGYIIINYRAKYNALSGWDNTQSFKNFRTVIEPLDYDKIYSNNEDITIVLN